MWMTLGRQCHKDAVKKLHLDRDQKKGEEPVRENKIRVESGPEFGGEIKWRCIWNSIRRRML